MSWAEGVDTGTEETTTKPAAKPKAKRQPAAKTDERVWIQLSDNKEIPPGGLPLMLNGNGFLLRPGVPAHVPAGLVGVLDNAIKDEEVIGDDGRISGYRKVHRFPYQRVSAPQ